MVLHIMSFSHMLLDKLLKINKQNILYCFVITVVFSFEMYVLLLFNDNYYNEWIKLQNNG